MKKKPHANNAALPHANNAALYDEAYTREFGVFYEQFTRKTLSAIMALGGPCSVLDLGCGTGRLAAPLGEAGYQVTAVDPCVEMLHQMKGKLTPDSEVEVICSTAQDFCLESRKPYDLALMLFTVVSYLLTDDDLEKALATAATSLAEGGSLLLDVPGHVTFQGRNPPPRTGFRRDVRVTPLGDDRFRYVEHCEIADGACDEDFQIKFWTSERVVQAAVAAGFAPDPAILPGFDGTHATYYRFNKAA